MLDLTFQVASLNQPLSFKNRRFIISTLTPEQFKKITADEPINFPEEVNFFYHYFGPYLYQTRLPKYIIDRLLVDGKNSKQDYVHQLAGHLDHEYGYDDKTKEWFTNEIQPIINSYRQGHCEYHGLPKDPIDYYLGGLWINFMKAGDYNPIHTHDGDYSFVIFLEIPEELEKEILEFRGTGMAPGTLYFQYAIQQRPQWSTTDAKIRPRTGDMYIFPSQLEHTVIPFKSDVTRISVSGNINIDKSQFSSKSF